MNFSREELLFQLALSKLAAKRAAWLDAECEGDSALRQRVGALLAAHEQASGFLPGDSSPESVATVIAEPRLAEEEVGLLIGRYKLLEKLGEGGFGAVWLAEQKEPVRRKVALKIIKLGMDTRQVVARFEAERQALALMDHPNIAKVLDAGTTDNGRPYFVMELVRGIPITKFCDENKIPTEDRLDLFMKVCHAIQHAHQKGIIHRDIKPSNVMVTLHDGVPVPKVIDFGIAKATQGELTDKTIHTQFQQFIGTPAYMSPEQAELSGLDIDTRSDIYSLGVLLYELLVGKTPFDAKDLLASGLDEMRRTIREKEPVRPSTRLTQLQGDRKSQIETQKSKIENDLDWIVMKCLEKDRTRRYETANGLATDLKRHLNNEPVVARPPSAAYRFQKLVRRNKLAFAAAAAVSATLVLGTIVSMWQAALAVRARNQATENEVKARQAEATATAEKTRADDQAKESKQNAAESRERLRLLAVANGVRLQNEGNLPDALLWFVHALTLVQGDAAREQLHRIRCASVLQHCPKLLQNVPHAGNVDYTEFSPDGTRIVTGGDDQTVRVWSVATGELITSFKQHSGRIMRASFSPEGRRVISVGFVRDGTVRVWEAHTGDQIVVVSHGEGGATDAEFSPDGRRIVTAGADRKAQVWDAATGQALLAPMRHDHAVWQARYSADGQRILTGSADGTARVWDATTGVPLTPSFQHERPLYSSAFSPDGRFVATGSSDWTARVWDAATGRPVSPTLSHDDGVWEVAFNPNGRQLVTASADAVIVWDTTTWKSSRLPLTPPHYFRLWGRYPLFSPDGKWLVTPFQGQSARVYDTELLKPVGAPLTHGASVVHAAFSPDNRRVVTASSDHSARVWDLTAFTTRSQISKHTRIVNRVTFSPDGRWIAIATGDGAAQVLEAGTGKPVSPPVKHVGTVLYTQFSRDGGFLVTVTKDGTNNSVRIWNPQTGEAVTPELAHHEPIEANLYGRVTTEVAFSSSGERMASTYTGNWPEVRVWETKSGKLIGRPFQPSIGASVGRLAFSPDSHWIVTACSDGVARVWNSQTGEPRTPPMPHAQPLFDAAFSQDGRLIVTGCSDGTAHVWDATTGEPIIVPLKHDHPVLYAELNPQATRVMTATEIGSWVWDLPSDESAIDELILQANILAARHIDTSLSLTPLTAEEILSGWQRLKSKYASRPRFDVRSALTPVELTASDADAEALFAKLRFTRDRPTVGVERKQHCLDRVPYLNSQFTNSMADFPRGRHEFDEVAFELHGTGVVRFASGMSKAYDLPAPEQITGIKVNRKCQFLHFLHCDSTSHFLGSYLIHFANGQKWEIPVLSDDLGGPQSSQHDGRAKRSVVVWQGPNRKDPRLVFQTTWQNPLPHVEIESIDFRSSVRATWGSPVLLAITVE